MKVICIKGNNSNGYLKNGLIYEVIQADKKHYCLKDVPSHWFVHRFINADFKTYLKKL